MPSDSQNLAHDLEERGFVVHRWQGRIERLDWPAGEVSTADLRATLRLPHLESMSFSGGGLGNSDLSVLSQCKTLGELAFSNIHLTRKQFEQVAHVSSLNAIVISGASVGDEELRFLGRLPRLSTIHADRTQITGSGFADLVHRDQLRVLLLNDCPVDDAGMKEIGKLCGLQRLSLRGTKISDQGLRAAQELTCLEHLYLGSTSVTDHGMKYVSKLVRLKDIDIADTNVGINGLLAIRTLPELGILGYRGSRVTVQDEGAFWIVAAHTWRQPMFVDIAQKGASARYYGEGAEMCFNVLRLGAEHLKVLDMCGQVITSIVLDGVELDADMAGRVAGAEGKKLANIQRVCLNNMAVTANTLRPFVLLPSLQVLDLTGAHVDDSVWSDVAELGRVNTIILKDAIVGSSGRVWLEKHRRNSNPAGVRWSNDE
ncbi:MAG: hypothetical protein RIC55_04090 [Pirellulaceae bacterium]